ncbi:hypothetical protein [Enterobacter sp. 56-7]|uniref:hypothetical protein n=1 Tax=Enterobacter sp. 56-7 TaxID=1895906 RepID=UPI00257CA253|nr:hypothetical protein [Enterobacter sp. 56-7]
MCATEAIAAYKKVAGEKAELETRSAESSTIRQILVSNGLFTSGDINVLAAELETNALKVREAQKSTRFLFIAP